MNLHFTVHGTPAPQGSKRHVGHGVMVESSKRLPAWRTLVTDAAWAARNGAPALEGPVHLDVAFGFRRPRSHYGTGRNAERLRPSAPPWPTGRNIGDLSKLVRALEDSLTDAGVWRDDAQVVSINAKRFWWDGPGAEVRVVQPIPCVGCGEDQAVDALNREIDRLCEDEP
ncbi:MAG TPA: RusA family crossover junction endodeoxyribonuclease [Patescibacteria group bacterium]|nr:RusA family crossover junction endodeoxyribonuclease [Patescibacteria group bacterium]